MTAYKQFTTQDVVITPFDVNKKFLFTGNEITGSNVGIDFFLGVQASPSSFISQSAPLTGIITIRNTTGVYYSIKQLYYSNFISSSIGDYVPTRSLIVGETVEEDRYVGSIEAPRYDNYLQSTLTQSRYFPTASDSRISVVSIPYKLFGENIVPSTFELNYTSSGGDEVSVIDDGEGNLVRNSMVQGQIFYPHGIAVFTTGTLASMSAELYEDKSQLVKLNIAFSSSYTLYENQYICTIRENELNYSQNPSLISGSSNEIYYDFATGSYFTPYVTAIGLYNDNKELLVVGKLSQPIPLSKYIDTSFILNFDT